MKINASIEARMGSSRLPGKVLKKAFNDILMLEYMVKRVKMSKLIDDVIVATTTNEKDNKIVEFCKINKIKFFRGSEDDVLLRVLNTHIEFKSDIIVELTGDCPLIDPLLIDKVILNYIENKYDYVSNGHIRSYPDGFDVSVFSTSLLKKIEKENKDPYDREHVNSAIYKTDKYKLNAIIANNNEYWPELRVTLDDVGDYNLIVEVLKYLHPKYGYNFQVKHVVEYIKNNPTLLDLNKNARFEKALYQTIKK